RTRHPGPAGGGRAGGSAARSVRRRPRPIQDHTQPDGVLMVEITPGQAYGFFTDTSVCIGCKACEVACKEWNQLPGNEPVFGDGYDNTGQLDAQNWRHVQFIDNVPDDA